MPPGAFSYRSARRPAAQQVAAVSCIDRPARLCLFAAAWSQGGFARSTCFRVPGQRRSCWHLSRARKPAPVPIRLNRVLLLYLWPLLFCSQGVRQNAGERRGLGFCLSGVLVSLTARHLTLIAVQAAQQQQHFISGSC
jgi:hypothetical protein